MTYEEALKVLHLDEPGELDDVAVAVEAEVERLREMLANAAKTLDLSQSLLERSSHHATILDAYKQAIAATEGHE